MNFKKILKKITPTFILDWYHYSMPLVGSVIFGFPSKKITVIGVTGTSGKSTTVDFITRILEEAGHPVASISSIRFKVGKNEWKNKLKMTTPGRFTIQKFLRQAVNAGCKFAVLEIASEGIKQHRHKFIQFDTAVFLNITPEHLDSHGGFENYRAAKLELFKVTNNVHVVNSDDPNAKYFLDVPAKKTITFGLHDGQINLKNNPFSLQILGEFNNYNALAAIAVATHYGVSKEVCKSVVESVKGLPGRLEVVSKKPLVVVDYAFTPDQLEASYQSVKKFSGEKNLVCVLGSCGGGRDKWKRPVLGKLAQQYCREIIITNEDPYDEDPLEIMQQVSGGIDPEQQPNHYRMVMDRKEAIEGAIAMAGEGDAVIITGKGAEPLMCLADGKKIPWDDRQIVRDSLAKR